ncbi:GNAT family N-acetyltransferase [Zongyangia hominis]|uniref:GNAT family N-acetyltransferase n=1 Tax=Zongyangia hominis TaxID=2763677 RepID=A0A926ECQ2_9FIRM|nr:GNAT family N-acetyltransferase [Zongyangia hominis]MBC8569531.1 GNAT family N-acetyltransferase [Zongyangia hominis]
MLQRLAPGEYSQVYQILRDSFPKSERRTRERQIKLMENEHYRIEVWREGDTVKAFLALWDFGDFLYVEHFAVGESYRNEGLGKKMLTELLSREKRLICLEVEPPQTEMAKRRIGFYERLGFFLQPYEYVQPALRETEPSLPLMIMSYPRPISREEFEKFRDTVYPQVYDQHPCQEQ